MPNQVVWPQCNIFDVEGNATILQRGELLPDDVDPAQVETLMVIGAVQSLEYAPNRPAEPESEPETPESEPETPELLEKPSPDANKIEWVAYATDKRNPDRMSEPAANSMSKSALMDRYK